MGSLSSKMFALVVCDKLFAIFWSVKVDANNRHLISFNEVKYETFAIIPKLDKVLDAKFWLFLVILNGKKPHQSRNLKFDQVWVRKSGVTSFDLPNWGVDNCLSPNKAPPFFSVKFCWILNFLADVCCAVPKWPGQI